ncbi:hypothetical protein Tco_0194790 [Tanacetum coccineum]
MLLKRQKNKFLKKKQDLAEAIKLGCIMKSFGKGRSGQTSSFGFTSAQRMDEEQELTSGNKRLRKAQDRLGIEQESLKRFSEELQTKTAKKLKFDDEGTQPTEEKAFLKKEGQKMIRPNDQETGKRKEGKQIARKGLHTDLDKDDSEDSDEASEKDDSTLGEEWNDRVYIALVLCLDGHIKSDLTELIRMCDLRKHWSTKCAKQCWTRNFKEENQMRIAILLINDWRSKLGLGSNSTMSNRHKDWLVQEQTALGKDFSNPLMADNLPKIVWLSTHHICFDDSPLTGVYTLGSNENSLKLYDLIADMKGCRKALKNSCCKD